ncbi:hypothetical protein ABEF92_008056 [Exophiala dermatitidis]|uniref:Something about silencing protein 4 domain-containing protein n=2 Tax=Exophiala dermatitidis TaxID=5970 RepID=H6C7D1_EXODN|nr:uncharacterized protein HMPREF1120_07612 [Exophiala dermatitidis NIH/UT8656]EHY59627.1 hypothetical protein HMPREF1120_07612 [Exophiala dermatitidis NIH/UT8656]
MTHFVDSGRHAQFASNSSRINAVSDRSTTSHRGRITRQLPLQHHEPSKSTYIMVAGSRSSLRRPSLRGHKSTRSSSPPNIDTPPLLPPSGDSGNAHRSKRVRTSTVSSGQQHDLKRRRLSSHKNEVQALRIPLRSRGVLPNVGTPASGAAPNASLPQLAINTSPATKPLDSPSDKPQYDQIRIIEERAKAAIRDGPASTPQAERRKLRSEDGGSRAKTELAQYFPDFEEMLSLKPPDPEALTVQTKIILVDDTPDFVPKPPRADPFGANKPLYNTQIIELKPPDRPTPAGAPDPLGEEVYSKIHSKAERHEKQMKNSDRERAQHEKYQLEKLLDDLRGPDWLKTLGISGVTDTEKRRYEPKRLLFIRETQALIDKFKRWKEEEKRRKLEKEQALLEEAMEEEEEEDDTAESSFDERQSVESETTQAPDSSELDALAALQLIEEAKSATKRKKASAPAAAPAPPPPKPFVSFFAKRHLRDAAVSGRQRGRTILAFGQPVPEFVEKDFELPDDILTEEAIRAVQRSRRRSRRGVDD